MRDRRGKARTPPNTDTQGRVMVHYRFYFLNEDDHIEAASDHHFANDAAAFAAALAMMENQPIEAWQSTRVVFRVSPTAQQPEIAHQAA